MKKTFFLLVCLFSFFAFGNSELDDILKESANKPQLSKKEWEKRIPQDFAIVNDHALLMNSLLKKYKGNRLNDSDFKNAKRSTERISKVYQFYSENVPSDKDISTKVESLYLAISHSHNLSLDFMDSVHKRAQPKFSNVKGTEVQIKHFKDKFRKYVKKYGIPKGYKPHKQP